MVKESCQQNIVLSPHDANIKFIYIMLKKRVRLYMGKVCFHVFIIIKFYIDSKSPACGLTLFCSELWGIRPMCACRLKLKGFAWNEEK